MAIGDTARMLAELDFKDKLTPGVNRAIGSIGKLEGKLGKIGGIAAKGVGTAVRNIERIGVVAGVAAIAIGTESVRAAMTFQRAMELIRTQAGGTQAEVEQMSAAVLNLAPKVGTGPDALAAGLYHVESAGFRGAKALEILTIAAEGAKVGNADLESVTNALVAAVNSGVKGVSDMGGAMGSLNAIVGAGNMRMADLAGAMTTGVLSAAKSFGVSIQSVGAALADMTNQGIPAEEAATRLRMTLSLLGAPTPKAVKLLKSIGIGQYDLATAMRSPEGIVGAVALLRERLDASGLSATKQAALLSRAFGGGRTSGGILTLIGSLDKLRTIQGQVNKEAGGFASAWAATQQESETAFDRFGAAFDTLKVRFGTALLPVITEQVSALTDALASPETAKAVKELARNLSGGFRDAVTWARGLDWQSIIAGGKAVVDIAKGVVSAFMAMPDWVKTAVITGWGLNKLTGGAIGSIIGELGKGLIRGVLGINAGVVNVNAGVVNGGVAGAAARGGGLFSTVKVLGSVIVAGIALDLLYNAFTDLSANVKTWATDLNVKIDKAAGMSGPSSIAAVTTLTKATLGIEADFVKDVLLQTGTGRDELVRSFATLAKNIGADTTLSPAQRREGATELRKLEEAIVAAFAWGSERDTARAQLDSILGAALASTDATKSGADATTSAIHGSAADARHDAQAFMKRFDGLAKVLVKLVPGVFGKDPHKSVAAATVAEVSKAKVTTPLLDKRIDRAILALSRAKERGNLVSLEKPMELAKGIGKLEKEALDAGNKDLAAAFGADLTNLQTLMGTKLDVLKYGISEIPRAIGAVKGAVESVKSSFEHLRLPTPRVSIMMPRAINRTTVSVTIGTRAVIRSVYSGGGYGPGYVYGGNSLYETNP